VKYDKYVDSAIELNFSLHGSESCFEIEIFSPKGIITNQISLYLVSFTILALQKVTRVILPLTKIQLINKEVADSVLVSFPFESIKVEHGYSKNKLYFNNSFLKQPLYSSNDLMHEILCTALDNYFSYKSHPNNIIDIVRREILIQNNHSVANISTVSKGLNIAERTLCRRLSELNITFKEIKKRTILERSKYYLEHTSMTTAEITYELGYSDTSAFCRAFKLFYNKSPQKYRDNKISVNC
jgi:AraC-like DNA-binding protein